MKKPFSLLALLKPFIKLSFVLSLFLFCNSYILIAQTGVLDVTFGNKGKVVTHVSIGENDDNIAAIAIQPDGKLVAVGGSWDGSTIAFTVVRFHSNGGVDSSFGTMGISRTAINNYADAFNAVAIQADGKILAVGVTTTPPWIIPENDDMVLIRYLPDGTLDSSFGNNGIVQTDFYGGADQPQFLLLRSDGKIIIGGGVVKNIQPRQGVSTDGFGLVQYKTNGALDSAFGVNGKVYTPINGGYAKSAILQGDNKMVVGGNSFDNATQSNFTLVRYNPNGSIDSGFGRNGMTITDFANRNDYGNSVSMQKDGKILFAGKSYDGSKDNIRIVRYKTNGTPDSSFGSGGKIFTSIGNLNDQATSVHAQPDGKILVSGYADYDYPAKGDFALLRYRPDGSIDSSFGKRGVILTDFFGLPDLAFTSLVQPDGKIVLAGKAALSDSESDFALARYERNALEYYNTLKGSVFIDNNLNGTKDVGEPFYNNAKVITVKTEVDTITAFASTGRFTLDVDTGTYTTTVQPEVPYYNIVPLSFVTNHSDYFNTDSILFALQPIAGKKDLAISLVPVTAARPGFNVQYKLTWRNQGTETIDELTVQLVKHNNLHFVSSSLTPTSTSADTLRWDFSGIPPFETGNILINFKVAAPPSVNNGDTLRSTATIFPIGNDVTPANNVSSLVQRVTGSYDPNDKAESHGGVIKPEHLTNGEYLTYAIRFQNTGTDTAFNVVVKDTLSNQLDWSTIQMVSYSHGYQFSMNEGICTWYFNNVLLVDSITNEPASHAYVVFRIKPKNSLSIGDTIKNTAAIYFDYNLPIETNTERTAIVSAVLPVKLLAFSAKRDGKANLLEWLVAQQINFSHFEVERSENGTAFAQIGETFANNTGKYNLTDNQPAKSINYYRLKMIDKDGRFEYSPVKVVNNSAGFYVSIYPNPAKESLNVKIESEKKETLYLEVIGLDGKVLVSKQAVVSSVTVVNINIKSLASGSYFLRVTSAGKEQTAFRFEKL